jgi:hypothetical protein
MLDLQKVTTKICARWRREKSSNERRWGSEAMLRRALIIVASTIIALVGTARADEQKQTNRSEPIHGIASALAQDLASACPLAEADDQRAFDSCRRSLFGSADRLPFTQILLWGTERKGLLVRDMELTEFDSTMWSGLYLSLWMFTGEWQVKYDETEQQNVIYLQAKFRNRLDHGQYPYPFWHSTAKWNGWQEATALKIYLDASGERVYALLRSKHGNSVIGNYPDVPPHSFDGRWRWPGPDGMIEPRVTLFDGLYGRDNPYLADLERSYQEFANEMRRSTCSGCHVPNNPNRIRRLVLLQTPAHAAAEIDRVIKAVREEKMPYEDWGDPAHLDPALRAALLDYATRFQRVVQQAQAWEKGRQSAAVGRIERRARAEPKE